MELAQAEEREADAGSERLPRETIPVQSWAGWSREENLPLSMNQGPHSLEVATISGYFQFPVPSFTTPESPGPSDWRGWCWATQVMAPVSIKVRLAFLWIELSQAVSCTYSLISVGEIKIHPLSAQVTQGWKVL